MKRYILACDEGTSSARSVLFNRDGRAVASAQFPIASSFPRDGWVEQDASEIWDRQLESVKSVLEKARASINDIEAVGITNQRETTVLWDKLSGEPVAPAITWQCRRTMAQCETINATGDGAWIARRSGLKVDPYFSATKLRWLLDSDPDLQTRANNNELAFGTVDSWLVYKLTNARMHAIDRTNASRTLLMDLRTGVWDDELMAFFDIPKQVMPEIVPSKGILDIAVGSVLGADVPIAGIAGDQQAALVGQGCTDVDSAKLTYGTGAFLLTHTGFEVPTSASGLLSTAAASIGESDEFALEGSVFAAGSAIQWLRDNLGLLPSASESDAIARSVPDCAGVYLVPAFEGLGAPHWAPHARGALVGLSRAADRRHIVRATLESIALQCYDLVATLEADTGRQLPELRVDGGAAANDFLLQFQADLLDRAIVRPNDLESTARGAATLAAYATGFWEETHYEVDRIFEPQMTEFERKMKLEQWNAAVDQVLSVRK